MHHDPLHIISVIVLIRSIVRDVVVARTCDHLKRYGGLSIKSAVPAYIQRMRNIMLIRTKSVCRQRAVPCNAILDGSLHGQIGVGCAPDKPPPPP